jgi:hypothetical protein
MSPVRPVVRSTRGDGGSARVRGRVVAAQLATVVAAAEKVMRRARTGGLLGGDDVIPYLLQSTDIQGDRTP